MRKYSNDNIGLYAQGVYHCPILGNDIKFIQIEFLHTQFGEDTF